MFIFSKDMVIRTLRLSQNLICVRLRKQFLAIALAYAKCVSFTSPSKKMQKVKCVSLCCGVVEKVCPDLFA